MGNEGHVVPKLAHEFLNPHFLAFCYLLSPLFARCAAAFDDIGSHLWNIGGIVTEVGLDNRNSLAHQFKQGFALVELVLIGFAIACVVTVSFGAKSASSFT